MGGKMIMALLMAVGLTAAGCSSWSSSSENTTNAGAAPDKKEQGRAEVRSVANDTLARLDALRPGARQSVERAAGYAVFTNYGLQIVWVGGGVGKGVAFNNRTHSRTYMKMAEGQVGIGLGARKIQLVWVFDSEDKFNDFVNKGWTFGGQGSASAAVDQKGAGLEGAVPIASGVWLYQLTETGLALELTVQGSKYYKDDELN